MSKISNTKKSILRTPLRISLLSPSPRSMASASSVLTDQRSRKHSRRHKINKPPLVLIHGFRGAPAGLEAIATELEKNGFSTYLPKIPPFAGAGELTDYNPHAYANYLASYIIENHLEQPILIGHSMGSVIAIATATIYPELVNEKLLLMSPISKRPPIAIRVISPLASYIPRKVVDFVTTQFLFVPHDYQLLRQVLQITETCGAIHPPRRKALARATHFSTAYSVADFNPSKQVFIIAGERDRLIGRQATERLRRQLNAQLTILPGTGHLHNYEKPLDTAKAILQYLRTA